MRKVTVDLDSVIELSHVTYPAKEEYPMSLDTRFTEQWPQFSQYKRHNDAWYLISEIHMNTHCSTHVEFPYHHVQAGADAATFPVERLMGEGVVIDISPWRTQNTRITLDDLRRVAEDKIRPGHIVYFYTGNDEFYYTPRQHERPWFTTACIAWLVERGIMVLGVDTSGIEVRDEGGGASLGQPNHEMLLGAGIPLVEYMTGLDRLLGKRFVTLILPLRIAGAEAFPVRVIAFEVENSA
ncbi:MAG: cyclase family protein [Anaerolineae bacterium]|nr:cyclase family protein [Anaerolineae bacterium]